MVNKKFTLLAVMLLTLGVASYAQQTTTFAWDWKDSSVVPAKSMTQYEEFMQNKNPFPPKPRNAWEVSGGIGMTNITGDSRLSYGLGGSLTLRKALGNVLSYRLGYFGAYTPNGKGSVGTQPTPDFRNVSHNVAIELVASLNTFSGYRGDPISNIYAFAGVGYMLSGTQIKGADGVWHYTYPPNKNTIAKFDHQRLFSTFSFGLGYAYKINKKFNLGIEERFVTPVEKVNYVSGSDLGTGTKNFYYNTYIKFNYNLFN